MTPCTCHGPDYSGRHEEECGLFVRAKPKGFWVRVLDWLLGDPPIVPDPTATELIAKGWYWSPDRDAWVYDRPEGGQEIGFWKVRP